MPILRCRAVLAVVGVAAPAVLLAGSPAGAARAVASLPGNPGNGATANASPPTGGRCSPATTRKVAGTLVAPGSLGLNATIGVTMLDKNGNTINLTDGCSSNGGYGAIVQLNHWVGAAGQAVGSEQHDAKGSDEGAVDPHWAMLNLPANVTEVYVEVYNRSFNGSPCGLPCAGPLDQKHFSQVDEEGLKPGAATSNLKLTPVPISKTGTLKLVFNRTDIKTVDIFSFAKKGPSNGWSVAGPQAGSSVGHASTWIAPALPASKNGYLAEVHLTDGTEFNIPDFDKGKTSGPNPTAGQITTVRLMLP